MTRLLNKGLNKYVFSISMLFSCLLSDFNTYVDDWKWAHTPRVLFTADMCYAAMLRRCNSKDVKLCDHFHRYLTMQLCDGGAQLEVCDVSIVGKPYIARVFPYKKNVAYFLFHIKIYFLSHRNACKKAGRSQCNLKQKTHNIIIKK